MLKFTKTEQQTQTNKLKLKQLLLEIERLQEESRQLFADLDICPEEFSRDVENKDNYSDEEWDTLQQEKVKLDQKLDLSLSNVRNTAQTKSAFAELYMSRNWIPMR